MARKSSPPAKKTSAAKSTGNKETGTPSLYVAVGASAGGLEAIESFFSDMDPDSGLAFIVIQHLSPDYKSLMVEILSKKTRMKVHRAEDGMRVLSNNIYLIPPKKNLTIFHGKLLLNDQEHVRGIINLPIDIFLRSLAEDQGEKAVAVILSGSGSDGMRGVRAVKEFGGMAMVQSEDSAKFDSMPRAAISTGLVDFILPPDEMPEQLLSFAKHPFVTKSQRSETVISDEDALSKIFSILREKFKVDFTFYKPSTVTRRIERRMSINRIDEIRDYVAYMQNYPGESATLFRELLIGVTRFFRDREVFEKLRKKYMADILNKDKNRESRFWIAGCSTGEEAYTLAILAKEYMMESGNICDLKIFATDIDRDAVHFAASGIYPDSIAADIPQELLTKYFYKKEDSYQIARNIREMVVFAQHNLIKDPPFTNVDLISCRNLLIYLQPVLQRKVFEFFNFSLNTKGIMLLGTSETTGDMNDYFENLDHKLKIYRTKGKVNHGLISSEHHSTPRPRHREHRETFTPGRRAIRPGEDRLLERFLDSLSQDYISLAVVVNEQLELLHVIGDTEGYFKLPAGKLSMDISKMAAKDLAIPLSTGIQKVFRKQEPLHFSNIRLSQHNDHKIVDMRIRPLPQKKGQEPLVAVFLDEVKKKETPAKDQSIQTYDLSRETEERINDLEQELQFTRENLQATVEELETANEELQATNEELLASNEELQSTNEELQSTNEELYSVNSEYQSKIMELTELHNDVDNLLSVGQIGQLLLDENMDIRRFSPKIAEIFKLLETDVGRSLSHISHHLQNVDPIKIITQAQKQDSKMEKEVQVLDGRWYLMRVVPYAVGPSVYSGVLVSFVDITKIKQAEEALRASEEKHRRLFETLSQGVVYHTADGTIISANPAAESTLGLSSEQMMGKTSMDPRWQMILEDGSEVSGDDHPAMISLRTGKQFGPVVRGVFHPEKNQHIWLNITAVPLLDSETGRASHVYAIFEDITEKRKSEQEVLSSHQRLTTILDSINALIYVADMDTHEILFINKYGRGDFGDVTGQKCWSVLQDGSGPCAFCTNPELLDTEGNPTGIYSWEFQNPKTGKWYHCFDRAIEWVDGRLVRLESAFDISDTKRIEESRM